MQQHPLDEYRVQQAFSQLGLAGSPSLFGPPLAGQSTVGFGAEPMIGPERSLFGQPDRDVPGALQGQVGTDFIQREGGGFFEQFKQGLISPITDTLSMVGARDPRAMPSSLGGIVGNIAGSILGWTALGVMTKGVGLAPLLAKVGAGVGVAGKAALAPAVKAGLMTSGTAAMVGKGAIYGAASQAHWAAGQQMPLQEIPKESLVGAVAGGVLGGGVGALASRISMRATPRSFVDKVKPAFQQAGKQSLGRYGRDATRMIHVKDPKSMSEALGTLADNQAFARRVTRSPVEVIENTMMEMKHPSPSTVWGDDLSVIQSFGRVNPYGSVQNELTAVQAGRKGFSLTSINEPVPLGMASRAIPQGSKYGEGLQVIARNVEDADRFVSAVANLDPTAPDFHVRLGRMLDYSETDISAFVNRLKEERTTNVQGLLEEFKKDSRGYGAMSPWLSKGPSNMHGGEGNIGIMHGLKGRDGRIFRSIVDNTEIGTSQVTAGTKLTKGMAGQFDKFKKARTFKETYDAAIDLQKAVRDNVQGTLRRKGVNNFRQLKYEDQTKIADWERMLQDMWWEMDTHVSKIINKSTDVALPSLNRIKDPIQEQNLIEKLRQEEITPDMVIFDPRAEKFLSDLNSKYGLSYPPKLHNLADTDFLPNDIRIRNQWTKLVEEIGEGNMIAFHHPLATIPIKERLPYEGLQKWIKDLQELPDGVYSQAISLEQSLMLEKPIGVFSRFLSPTRTILGEPNMRILRQAGVADKQFRDVFATKLKKIGDTLGATSESVRRREGVKLAQLIEGTDMQASANISIREFSRRLSNIGVGPNVTKTKGYQNTINEIASDFNVKPEQVKKVWKRVQKVFTTHEDTMKETARIRGIPEEQPLADLFYNNLRDIRLDKAGWLTGKRLEAEARAFNTTPQMLKSSRPARDLMNELFIESGLDPDMYRAAYVPHFNDAAIQKASHSTLRKTYRDLKLPEDKIDSIFWANELHRKGSIAEAEPNFFHNVERYISGLSKKKHYEPAIKSIDKNFRDLGKVDHTRLDVWDSVKEHIVGIPTEQEKIVNQSITGAARFLGKMDTKGRHAKEIGSVVAELQYAAGMGFNPWMPIRNLTQKFLSASSITDSGNPLEGLYWIGRAKMQKASGEGYARIIGQHNRVLHGRVFQEGLELQVNAIERAARRYGVSDAAAAKYIGKPMRKSMDMFKWSDKSNVEDVFNAQALYLIEKKGANFAEAIEIAHATTMATQFMYGIDSPMLYKTPIGKQIGIFQSWPLNWANMLWEQGTSGQVHRAVGTVMTMAIAAEALSMTGITLRTIHPVETARGILPYAMMEGEMQFPASMRFAAGGLDYLRSLGEGDDEATQQAINNFTIAAEGLVPFGVVTNRTLTFLDRVRHDWKDYEDPGFLHTRALSPQTREHTNRLRHEIGPTESIMGLIGTTERSMQRQDDWKFISAQLADYRRLRGMAVDAFIDGDYTKFMDYQERLVMNFGEWIEPQDIHREIELMSKSARERQLQGLPEFPRSAYLQVLEDRYDRGY